MFFEISDSKCCKLDPLNYKKFTINSSLITKPIMTKFLFDNLLVPSCLPTSYTFKRYEVFFSYSNDLLFKECLKLMHCSWIIFKEGTPHSTTCIL